MLRIEKKPRKQRINLGLYERSRMLTPTFLAAFGIAFALHLGGALLFHISPIKLRHAELIFRPVQVNIDFLPAIDSGVLAELDNEESFKSQISEPVRSEPRVLNLMHISTDRRPALRAVKGELPFPFDADLFRNYTQLFISFEPGNLERDPIVIRVGGELSKKSYFFKEAHQEFHSGSGEGERRSVSYRVKVENRTGKIFWFLPITTHEKKRLFRKCEAVLSLLEFEKSENGVFTEGEVEIELVLENQEFNG